MCGICGIVNGKHPHQKRLLSILNESRGKDSVGFWTDGKRTRVAESITTAITEKRVPSYVWDSEVFLCHTRAASGGVGGNAKENTHPFKSGHITGAHNGYISNWKDLKDEHKAKYPHIDDYNVDSQMIFFMVNTFGHEGLKKLQGRAAAWWVDDREPDKFFIWLHGGDLFMYEDKKDKVLAFSSQGDHLRLAGFTKKVSKLKAEGQLIYVDTKEGASHRMGYFPGKAIQATYNGNAYNQHGHAGNGNGFRVKTTPSLNSIYPLSIAGPRDVGTAAITEVSARRAIDRVRFAFNTLSHIEDGATLFQCEKCAYAFSEHQALHVSQDGQKADCIGCNGSMSTSLVIGPKEEADARDFVVYRMRAIMNMSIPMWPTNIDQTMLCRVCNGSGMDNLNKNKECDLCKGCGYIVKGTLSRDIDCVMIDLLGHNQTAEGRLKQLQAFANDWQLYKCWGCGGIMHSNDGETVTFLNKEKRVRCECGGLASELNPHDGLLADSVMFRFLQSLDETALLEHVFEVTDLAEYIRLDQGNKGEKHTTCPNCKGEDKKMMTCQLCDGDGILKVSQVDLLGM